MIHHYINLVCWRAMHDLYREERDIIWADSISMVKLLGWFGHSVEYRPGTFVVAEAIKGGDLLRHGYFLTARPIRGVPDARQLALPMIPEGSEHYVPEEVLGKLRSLAPRTPVVLGVSAPKQNRLAAALHDLRPDLTYHCLGAALTLIDEAAADPSTLEYSRSGKEWLRFFQEAPKRTLRKLYITIVEIARVTLLPGGSRKFRKFARMCQPKIFP